MRPSPGPARSGTGRSPARVCPRPRSARSGPGASPAAGQMAGVSDGLFAAAATDGSLTELTLSQLGVQQATDPELKQFSQQMIEDHTRMGTEMRSLITQKGLRVPEMVDVRSQFCAQSLAGLSGEEFDRCYAKAQLIVHMDSVAMFEAEAERGMDPDVKAMAAKALPHIKAHLKAIKPIAQTVHEGEGGRGEQPAPDRRKRSARSGKVVRHRGGSSNGRHLEHPETAVRPHAMSEGRAATSPRRTRPGGQSRSAAFEA